MAQLRVLTAEEIYSLFSSPQEFFFFVKGKQKLSNSKYDIIGISTPEQAQSFLIKYFRQNQEAASQWIVTPLVMKSIEKFLTFFERGQITRLCIADVGIFTIQNVQEASQLKNILQLLEHKLDNENFYWIGFADGHTHTKNGALCIYLDFNEAQFAATQVGGHLGTINIVEPVFTERFVGDKNYYLKDMTIKGYLIKRACQYHFQRTLLSFDVVKQYIDRGLSVFAGQNDWDEFEVFTHQGMSTLFSARADKTLIHPLIQQSFPQDSDFYPVQKRESLYSFAETKFINIDCTYHCTREIFENAIMGRNDYQKITDDEKIQRVQKLFNTQYLYVILSREEYKEKHHASTPSIIESARRKIWIFEDYGKALNFCQQKDRFVAEGIPAIGLLSATTDGWDLHSILSLLLTINVADIEVNPLEDDRILLSIHNMLQIAGLQPKDKQTIKRIQLDKPEDEREEIPWIFNDIVLA